MSRNGNFSVFKRLFLIHSLSVALIYVLLVILFLNNIDRSSGELTESKKMQSGNFLRSLEQQLDTIYSHEVNLTNSAVVKKLAYAVYADSYEKNQLILELLRDLEGIQLMSPLIEEVIVTYPSRFLTLSSVDGYERKTGEEWIQVNRGSEYDYLIAYGGRIVMNFSYPLMYSESRDYVPDFNIQIVLSKTYLAESLGTFRDEEGNGAAIRFLIEGDFFIENDGGQVAESYFSRPGGDLEKNYQFITTDSMKYPLSVIAFIDGNLIREIKVRYISLLTAVMVILTSLHALSLIYTRRIIVKPIRELMSAFGRIRDGDFDVRIYHEPHDEFNYLYHGFNDAVSYIQKLIADIYEQENLIQNAELAQLQSQINPHFLYNSFFIINRMAKNESYEQITRFVTSLARYYRFINKETKDFIPLEKEVEHMGNYIDIQQMRFSDKISVEQEELSRDFCAVPVPKLILQPLIENGYNHGLVDKLEGGLIRIGYEKRGAFLEISVEDNGEEADDSRIGSMRASLSENTREGAKHALVNIHRRLQLAYGEPCGISIERSRLGGIRIVLRIALSPAE